MSTHSNNPSARLLIVDNSNQDRSSMLNVLREDPMGFQVDVTETIAEAMGKLSDENQYDVILFDLSLVVDQSLDLISLVEIPVVVTSEEGNEARAGEALRNGAYDFIVKDSQQDYLKVLAPTIHNIVERRRVEVQLMQRTASLKNERFHFESLMSHIPDAIYFKDRESRFIRVNNGTVQLLGAESSKQVLGKTDADFFTPEEAGDYRSDELQILEDGKPIINKEEVEVWSDGEQHVVLTTKMPLRNESGEIIGIFGVSRDITDLKRQEATIREHDEKLRMLVESVKDYAIITLDHEGLVTSWNSGAERLHGYPEDEILGQHFACFSPPNLSLSILRQQLYLAEENGSYEVEGTRLRKDGSRFWANVLISALRDRTGAVAGFSMVVRDLTERKRHEDKTRDAERRLRGIIDNAQSFIGLMSTDGVVLDANRTSLATAGVSADEVIGRPFWEAPWWSHSEAQREQLKRSIRIAAKGKAHGFEATHPIGPDQVIDVDFSLSPVVSEDGEVIYLVPEGRDITRSKQNERELETTNEKLKSREKFIEEKNEQLRRLNEELLQFAYSASHDLKAPLASMTGLLRFCLSDFEEGDHDEVKKNLAESISLAERLAGRIEDMLSIAQTDMMDAQWEKVDLGECIDEIWKNLKPEDVEIDRDFQHTGKILTVRTRLFVILENLISNAVKFRSPTGKEHRIQIRTSGSDIFRVEIEDNGVGIPKRHINKVFNLFYRAANSNRPGSGLGLALVKKNIAHLGGNIKVESGKVESGSGKRTVFILELPQSPVSFNQPHQPADPADPELAPNSGTRPR